MERARKISLNASGIFLSFPEKKKRERGKSQRMTEHLVGVFRTRSTMDLQVPVRWGRCVMDSEIQHGLRHQNCGLLRTLQCQDGLMSVSTTPSFPVRVNLTNGNSLLVDLSAAAACCVSLAALSSLAAQVFFKLISQAGNQLGNCVDALNCMAGWRAAKRSHANGDVCLHVLSCVSALATQDRPISRPISRHGRAFD